MKMNVYADNAATTKLKMDAFEAMKPFLLEDYANASQPYSFSRRAKKALAEARSVIARCINAEPEEIFFTSGGTESDNWVIKASAFGDPEKRATITSAIEHHALLHSCTAIERLGYPVVYLPVDIHGLVQPDTLQRHITDKTRLVSVMMANNEIGTIEPIKELCSIAHEHGALFHTDAVQAVGHIPIDVKDLGIDFLSASAHKFNGPKGVGFLYIRKGTPILSFADGGAQEHGLRAGTENVAGIVGMATALLANVNAIKENENHLRSLEHRLESKLQEVGIHYCRNGSAVRLPGVMSLSFEGSNGETLLHRLDLMGICVSTGSACDSQNTQISHVLAALGMTEFLAKGTIRISLGKDNTYEEIDYLANGLLKILSSIGR